MIKTPFPRYARFAPTSYYGSGAALQFFELRLNNEQVDDEEKDDQAGAEQSSNPYT